ncbi:MAG: pyridoxal 5'-phosphate synthase glutaminase subunit PdxT [Ornithinimicrobium sp.]|uniref:pyridoxal 5'-phosphate synthase glutaminase subunit PdxT n=1 Tax=Ornithinimicrobium sp. TaxID=1977084 RepID=UPI003D9BFAE2
MVTPRVGVLALQGDVREHVRALTLAGAEAVLVRRPEEVEAVDALVLPGGESTTIDRLSRVFGLREPVRRRIAEGMPVYGSCAGMILLADRVLDGHRDQQTLGGLDITVRRNAFGRQVDSFECDLSVSGLPDDHGQPYRAVFIRAPWVEQVGAGVEVLATVEHGGTSHVVAVRQGSLLATSFHPEMTEDHRVHAFFVDLVRAQSGSRSDDNGEGHR